MHIAKDTVVSIEYSVCDADNNLIDATEVGQPLAYLHGHGNVVPGLEEALEGRSEGECITRTVPPEKAYGDRDEALVQSAPPTAFPEEAPPRPGMQYEAETEDGGHTTIIVTDVQDNHVTIDANPALAGLTLHFDVTIAAVREASETECETGDVAPDDR